MIVNFSILPGGRCVPPCPNGKAARVYSYACKACGFYKERLPGESAIKCNYHEGEGDFSA